MSTHTFKFNDIRLGAISGWNVTLKATDALDAMQQLKRMDEEQWRRARWRRIVLLYHPFRIIHVFY